jgi:hypothetical protein
VRRRVFPLVVALFVLGAGGAVLRSWTIGYPLVPRITQRLWAAHLTVEWTPEQAPVSVSLPRNHPRQQLRDERFAAEGLETVVSVDPDGTRRLKLSGEGTTAARYEVEILVGARAEGSAPPRKREDPSRWQGLDTFAPPAVEAARRIGGVPGSGSQARRCFDLLTGRVGADPAVARDVEQVRSGAPSVAEALVLCWRAAGLAARLVQAWPLRSGFYRQVEILAEVFEGSRWVLADPERHRFPAPATWLLWAFDSRPLAQAGNGAPVAWRVDLFEERQTLWAQFFRQTADRQALLARWSLYAIPREIQEVFRVLLVVPFGALIVAVLRNVVGFLTFGTFMPVLIAVAFRQTTLAYGLVLFVFVVGAGYLARRGIERYKLLLVPRLSVILTFVILCLATLALIGTHAGLRHVVFIGLLPMVILTMTIERFHVVMEESGAGAALRQAAGTGAVVALIFGVISWEYLQLLFFTYPELLLAVAAGQVALGRYVGFRLTELWRFRRLAETS